MALVFLGLFWGEFMVLAAVIIRGFQAYGVGEEDIHTRYSSVFKIPPNVILFQMIHNNLYQNIKISKCLLSRISTGEPRACRSLSASDSSAVVSANSQQ
jgi:hypothetical protein